MNWRPEGWRNPYKHSDTIQAWDIPEAYHDVSDEEWIAFESGGDAILEGLKPLLTIIHAQLCGVRIEKGKTPWYSSLDKSIDDISQILGKVNQ